MPAIAPPLMPDEDLLVDVAPADERMLFVDELAEVVESREDEDGVVDDTILVLERTDDVELTDVDERRVEVLVELEVLVVLVRVGVCTRETLDVTEVTTSRTSEVVEETMGVLSLREVGVAAFAEVVITGVVVARMAEEDIREAVVETDIADVVTLGPRPEVGAPARGKSFERW